MAERRYSPKQPKSFAADAAIFLSAALFSLPALASNSTPIPCPLSVQATLKVSPDELVATTVSHDVSYVVAGKAPAAKSQDIANPVSLLAPRAEAAIREAFRDGETAPAHTRVSEQITTIVTTPMAGTEAEIDASEKDAKIETPSGMTTRLPGVSDDDLSRFKKQMFRRDI